MKFLKRSIVYICLFLVTTFLVVSCRSNTESTTGGTEAQTLNIYNWATYITPEVLDEFQKTYNVKIKYDNFDSEDTLYAKLKPGNPGYDLIFPSDYMLQRMVKEEMLVIPKEGTTVYTDLMAIPKGAPHKELAEQFINFILEPKVGAAISNYIHYGSPNLTARTQGLINTNDLKNPAIYPPPEIWAKLQYVEDVGSALNLYDRAWTEVKAAFGG